MVSMTRNEIGAARAAFFVVAFLLTAAVAGVLLLTGGEAPDDLLMEESAEALELQDQAPDQLAEEVAAETEAQREESKAIAEEPVAEEEDPEAIPEDATGVSGRIIGRDGKPAVGLMVMAERIVTKKDAARFGVTIEPGDRHARYTRTGETDAEGHFTIIELVSSTGYRIRIKTDQGFIGRHSDIEVFEHAISEIGDVPLRRGAQVSGLVRAEGGRPVVGAEIEFGWSWSAEPIVSDEQGRFDAGVIFPGRHQIQVKADGYALPESVNREFVEGDRVNDLELEMVRAAPIRGRVVDEAGRGIAEVSVIVNREDNSWFGWYGDHQYSREDGSFAFETIAPGKYSLNASKQGYKNQGMGEITAGGAPLELRLKRSAVIEGIVLNARTNEPVKPEELKLYWISPWRQREESPEWEPFWSNVETDIRDDGTYSIGLSRHGKFKVEARADGFATGRSEPFEIKADTTVSGILIRLEPGMGLAVTVLDEATREPVKGAVVDVHRKKEPRVDPGSTAQSRLVDLGYIRSISGGGGPGGGAELGERVAHEATDGKGTVQIDSLETGSFQLVAKKRGYARSDILDVELNPGITTPPAEIVLGPGGAIEGKVANQLGEAEPALKVIASGPKNTRGEAISLENGRYRIENLTPGRYKVEAELENKSDANEQMVFFGGDSRGTGDKREIPEAEKYPVVVAEGKTTDHDVTIERIQPGSLVGSVLINGTPAANISVMLNKIKGGGRGGMSFGFNNNIKTDEFGKFEFRRLAPADYGVLVHRSWNAMFDGGKTTVTSGIETQMIVDVGLGGLFGRVLDGSQALQGASVRLSLQERGSMRYNPFGGSKSDTSAGDGGYRIDELQNGVYRMTVSLRGYRTQTLSDIQISSQRDTGPMDVQMQVGGWIQVRVENLPPSGSSRPDRLRLDYRSEDGKSSRGRWERPDENGLYWIEAGHDGRGTVTVTRRATGQIGEMKGSSPVELEEGNNLEVTVRLN